jgi:hypothetical protein
MSGSLVLSMATKFIFDYVSKPRFSEDIDCFMVLMRILGQKESLIAEELHLRTGSLGAKVGVMVSKQS